MLRYRYLLILFFSLIISNVSAKSKVSPESVAGATTIDTQQAKVLFDKGVKFLDVRSGRDWAAGRIPASMHLELKKIFNQESLTEMVSQDEPLVIYCNSVGCMRSSKASAKAVSWGYEKVYYYRLGYPDWKKNGYAIE